MDIRERVSGEVFDYQQLVGFLSDYAKPRDRIGRWLADGSLVRVRKGLYVFGERYRRAPLSREHLANLIYGPSYVSLDYALAHCGMIPERVQDVTSVTTGETRRFTTPLGVFTYRHLSPARYAPGIVWAGAGDARFLMASPEKALADKVWADKRFRPAKIADFADYLAADLRVDDDRLDALDPSRLDTIARAYAARRLDLLMRYLARRKEART